MTPRVRPLAARQHAVAVLIGQGLTYAEVAARLDMAPRTVGVHVARIAAKLPGATDPRHRIIVWYLTQRLAGTA